MQSLSQQTTSKLQIEFVVLKFRYINSTWRRNQILLWQTSRFNLCSIRYNKIFKQNKREPMHNENLIIVENLQQSPNHRSLDRHA